MKLRKIVSFLLAVLIFASIAVTGISAFGEETAQSPTAMSRTEIVKPKVINIVYDDSGSMVNGDVKDVSKSNAYIPRWALAKYSLETFIGMLDENDFLNIYTMSGKGQKYTSIAGEDKAKSVKKIHSDFKTGDYSVKTPINTLDSAYDNLKEYGSEYEKWLIVLTDGAFTDLSGSKLSTEKVNTTLKNYGKGLDHNLVYIPIETAPEYVYESNEFTTLTDSDGTILDRLQKAAELIYPQRDVTTCEVNGTTAKIDTGGISMSQLIIFAQGSGVTIDSIDSGKIAENISVKYTEADRAVNYDTAKTSFKNYASLIKTDESLQGVVATIEPSEAGGYITSDSQITVTFGEKSDITNCVVYYVPAVELQYSLIDSDNNVWLSSENTNSYSSSISPGQYILKTDIIDSGTKKGNLDKNAKIAPVTLNITVNGNQYGINELQEGVPVDLYNTEDLADIDAAASILNGKYAVDTSDLLSAFSNTIVKVSYSLKVDFTKEKSSSPLNFKFKKTDFILHSLDKIDDYEDMLKATVSCYDPDGNQVPITNEVWEMVRTAPVNGSSTDGTSIYIGNPSSDTNTNVKYDVYFEESVTESGEGIFYVCPRYVNDKNGKTDKKHTTHQNYLNGSVKCSISAEINIPNVSPELAYSTTPTSIEDKSGTYEIAICMWYTIVILFIFFWFLGYSLKKKLPRKKHGICINKVSSKRVRDDDDGEYHWKSDRASRLPDDTRRLVVSKFTKFIPYATQKGSMDLEFSTLPTLEFKATFDRKKVELINDPKDFSNLSPKKSTDAKNKYVAIDGIFLTEKNVEAEKENEGKFVFNLTDSFIQFGGAESSSRYKGFEIQEFEK